MQAERFRQLRNRGAGAARKLTEQAQLVCRGQGLEGPEAGRSAISGTAEGSSGVAIG